jgi:hypothetical protein
VLCKPIGSPCDTEFAAQRDVMALAFDFQDLQFKTAQIAWNAGLLCVVVLRFLAAGHCSSPLRLPVSSHFYLS